jgi:integrase
MSRFGDLDRYLKRRGNSWVYYRRVPTALANLDARAPSIRHALGTRDLAVARRSRDVLAAADDELWASMTLGENIDRSRSRYAAALKRVKAMGFGYASAADLGRSASWDELSSRMEAILPSSTPKEVQQAVLGTVPQPQDRFEDALRIYVEGPGKLVLANKSPNQLRLWQNIPKRAIRRFVEVVGDKPLASITRDDAVRFYRFWLNRIMPDDDAEPLHPSSGNREIGELRKLYREYFSFEHNDKERLNPFLALGFPEDGSDPRPPFPISWIEQKFLTAGPLAGLNPEARGVLLAMIETGCRPSEICNLTPSAIVLDAEVPHISVRPRRANDRKNVEVKQFGPHEVKSAASVRAIPLVGVALKVFERFPEGFARYMDKTGTASQTINTYLEENALLPTPDHTIYGLRHTFEDRMKRANIDYEVRMGLFGHTVSRPNYGSGGGLAWQRDLLKGMALRFEEGLL